jgi:hypothetical protein
MSAIPSGVVYESLEDQFLGSAQQLLAAQLDPLKNTATPQKTLINSMSFNSATGNYSITATIPCVSTISADGMVSIDASESFL